MTDGYSSKRCALLKNRTRNVCEKNIFSGNRTKFSKGFFYNLMCDFRNNSYISENNQKIAHFPSLKNIIETLSGLEFSVSLAFVFLSSFSVGELKTEGYHFVGVRNYTWKFAVAWFVCGTVTEINLEL